MAQPAILRSLRNPSRLIPNFPLPSYSDSIGVGRYKSTRGGI